MVLDPNAQTLQFLLSRLAAQPFETLTPLAMRRAYDGAARLFNPPLPPVKSCQDFCIRGPGGADLPIRLIAGREAPEGSALLLLFLHGGGWVMGGFDSHDYLARRLANRAQCLVACVDYRLAPECPFPAGLEDCAAAAVWLLENAKTIGADPSRFAVGGDSAGANFASVLTLMAREKLGLSFCLQMLLYGAFDLRARPWRHGLGDDMPLNDKIFDCFIKYYLPDQNCANDWRASPLIAANHAECPPAFMVLTRHDPLYQQGCDYAAALDKAGVRVWLLDLNDQHHGFLANANEIGAAKMVLEMAGAALAYAFGARAQAAEAKTSPRKE